MQIISSSQPKTPFEGLSPDLVIACAERLGIEPDGRLFALNSYENRVYQLGSDSHGPLVLKFYRAGRWSDAQILEEHAFALELVGGDLPVAAPLTFDDGTLCHHDSLRYAVFRKESARAVELDAPGALELIGRTLGRMHAVGARRRFQHRPELSIDRLGWQARSALLRAVRDPSLALEAAMIDKYAEASETLLETLEQRWSDVGPLATVRLHGDCHLGNLLWNERGPVFVDLDDCLMGPRVQDLWMFLSGSQDERDAQWETLLRGYRQFHEIDAHERDLVEGLRALRMIHHTAWIAARWADPAFPRAFPWFTTPRYWSEYVSDLWQQRELL